MPKNCRYFCRNAANLRYGPGCANARSASSRSATPFGEKASRRLGHIALASFFFGVSADAARKMDPAADLVVEKGPRSRAATRAMSRFPPPSRISPRNGHGRFGPRFRREPSERLPDYRHRLSPESEAADSAAAPRSPPASAGQGRERRRSAGEWGPRKRGRRANPGGMRL